MSATPPAYESLDLDAFVRREAVWTEVLRERIRAHAKHRDSSMEAMSPTDMTRLSVLMEEVGEVAREYNEARHRTHSDLLEQAEREQSIDLSALYKELIQVAAMAGAWADRIALAMEERYGQRDRCIKPHPHPDGNPIHLLSAPDKPAPSAQEPTP